MSITRRLIHLARVNLSALLDGEDSREQRLRDLPDEELEAELRRRREQKEREARARQQREAAEKAARERAAGRGSEHSQRPGHEPRHGGPTRAQLARYYAQLECPQGADFETVKRQYRKLMRKYHPDLHSGDAEKQRIATELAKALTQAYSELNRALRGGRDRG